MTAFDLEFGIRPGVESDWAFCADAWVQTLRGASRESKSIPKEVFFPHWHQQVGELLKTREVRIACPPDDGLTIFGFAVVGRGVVEFAYVKTAFRKLGIAKTLLADFKAEQMVVCTHWSRELGEWVLGKYPTLNYIPYLSERETHGERSDEVA